MRNKKKLITTCCKYPCLLRVGTSNHNNSSLSSSSYWPFFFFFFFLFFIFLFLDSVIAQVMSILYDHLISRLLGHGWSWASLLPSTMIITAAAVAVAKWSVIYNNWQGEKEPNGVVATWISNVHGLGRPRIAPMELFQSRSKSTDGQNVNELG